VSLTLAGFELDRRTLITIAVVALACIGLVLLYGQIDVAALHRRAQNLNGPLVFVLITILPLAGFPVSVTNAVAGVRFGFGMGVALVSLSIALQLLASYALVKAAPKFFVHRLEPLHQRLPAAAHTPLTQFTMLLPGVPYFGKNYLLPMVGVPLGTYLLLGFPIHVARSVVGIISGDMSGHLTAPRITGFVVYTIVITVGCAWALRQLRAKMRDRPTKVNGRKRPA